MSTTAKSVNAKPAAAKPPAAKPTSNGKPAAKVQAAKVAAKPPPAKAPAAKTAATKAAGKVAATGDKKTPRVSDLIGIDISHSRVKSRLNRLNLNKAIDDEIDIVKSSMKGKSGNAVAQLEEQCKALSRGKVRVADSAPIALACVLDQIVQQLATAGFANAKQVHSRSTLTVDNLVDPEVVQSVELSALFELLPSVTNARKELAEAAAAALVAKGAADETVEKTKESARDLVDDTVSRFDTYVSRILKKVKSEVEEFKTMRVSAQVTTFFNSLLSEVVDRFAMWSQVFLHSNSSKTVDNKVVMSAAKLMLLDGCKPTEKVVFNEETRKDRSKPGTTQKVRVAHVQQTFPNNSFSQLDEFVQGRLQVWEKSKK